MECCLCVLEQSSLKIPHKVPRENNNLRLPLNVTDVGVLLVILLSEIDVWIPEPDHSEVPAEWWDADADKSLLIGVFKHGE